MPTPIEILKKYWKYDQFRPLQEDIIQSIIDGNDTFVLMPTGGGKSLCFQIPALCMEGICIVISPLIALMKDQIEQLQKRGIKAVAIYTGMSNKEIDIALNNCIYGNYKFLYVSPERLKNNLFLERANKLNINLLAVDEAHCISQWGYDFRPHYLQIEEFKTHFNIQRTMALTASAPRNIRYDIIEKLKLKKPNVFKKSFFRKNISYSVFKSQDKFKKLFQIITNVKGSSIVYVRNRKRTKEVAEMLIKNGFDADYYHAGLDKNIRSKKQSEWGESNKKIMISTNAFGMGIDKPNVRTVIHIDIPESLEAYYQEAGRAGRDEKKAYAVLLYDDFDIATLKKNIQQSVLKIEFIQNVYHSLCNFFSIAIGSGENATFDFDIKRFTTNFKLPIIETYHAIKKLENNGIILLNENPFQKSKVNCIVSKEKLIQFQSNYKSLEVPIKVLLRIYGGELFSNFIDVVEENLAKIAKVNTPKMIEWLETLHKHNIIEYQKYNQLPKIEFLTSRYEAKYLPIDKDLINFRNKVILEKSQKIIEYCESTNSCRTQFIEHYFDERTDKVCHICDYCISLKDKYIDPNEVINFITKDGVTLEYLTTQLNRSNKKILNCLRLLVEENKIYIDKNKRILLK